MVFLHLAPWNKIEDRADLLTAWEDGRDFKLGKYGPYCSIRDLDSLREGYGEITVVNNNKVHIILSGYCAAEKEYEEIDLGYL